MIPSALPTELPIFERAVGTDEVLQRRLHLSNYVRVTPLPFIIAYVKLADFVIVLSCAFSFQLVISLVQIHVKSDTMSFHPKQGFSYSGQEF